MKKDFLIQVKVKNARMRAAMDAAGIHSLVELSRISGVDYRKISHIYRFVLSPVDTNGQWHGWVETLSAALNCSPVDIWPEHLVRLTAIAASVSIYANIDEISRPSISGGDVENAIDCEKLLALLPDREREVIKRNVIDGETYQEIADSFRLSTTRIQAIADKGFRRLRGNAKTAGTLPKETLHGALNHYG